jgi:hypothetical protein
MEYLYDLPSGDQARVMDTATAARHLRAALQLFREGGTEPLFFGDHLPAGQPRPEGVVISFEQWAEYEALRTEAEFEQRVERVARERLASAKPEDYVPFEDMMRELGEDPEEGEAGKPETGRP